MTYQTTNRKLAENENRLDTTFNGSWVSGATLFHDRDSPQSHINDLFVCAEERRKGHGRQMMEYIVAEFAGRELSLMVYPDNTGAILLYEQIGFKPDGPLDESGLQYMTRKGNDDDES